MEVFISVGSNSADKVEQVAAAIHFLGYFLEDAVASSVYTSAAVNGRDADYANAVVCGRLNIELAVAESILKEWERECGRTEESKRSGVVPIDLDIVVADGRVLRQRDFERSYFEKGYREIVGKGSENGRSRKEM